MQNLQPDTYTQRNKLDFGQMGFHSTLYEQMPRETIAQGYLRIEPAVGIARRACTEQVIFVENAFIEPPVFRLTGFVSGLQVLDRIEQINTEMETCRKPARKQTRAAG